MTPTAPRLATRLAAPVAAALLVLTACGGSDDDAGSDETVAVSETIEVAPETTEAAPETTEASTETTEATTETTEVSSETTAAGDATTGAALTPLGSELAFGESAVVALDEALPDALIELTVHPIGVGTPEELAELQVEDLVGGETLHYLTLDIANLSTDPTEDLVPSWSTQLFVMQDNGDVAVPVINFTAFEPCDEEDPDEVPVGESFTTCLTYLAAPGTTATSVVFAQSLSSDTITWS